MASEIATGLDIELVAGEDFACQLFWVDEYGDPVPIVDPIQLDVRDANGQTALRFLAGADPATAPNVTYISSAGFFQLTVPAAVSRTLIPGRYVFDLWAAVADSASPFARQVQQVVSGVFSVLPRITRLEGAPVLPVPLPTQVTVPTQETQAPDFTIETAGLTVSVLPGFDGNVGIDWGDGQSEPAAAVTRGRPVNHTYRMSETFAITLTGTTSDNRVVNVNHGVRVIPLASDFDASPSLLAAPDITLQGSVASGTAPFAVAPLATLDPETAAVFRNWSININDWVAVRWHRLWLPYRAHVTLAHADTTDDAFTELAVWTVFGKNPAAGHDDLQTMNGRDRPYQAVLSSQPVTRHKAKFDGIFVPPNTLGMWLYVASGVDAASVHTAPTQQLLFQVQYTNA